MKPRLASTSEHEKFTKALSSVLSASSEQIRESRAQAKAEKPSPHTRYTYAPEEGQPYKGLAASFPVNSTHVKRLPVGGPRITMGVPLMRVVCA